MSHQGLLIPSHEIIGYSEILFKPTCWDKTAILSEPKLHSSQLGLCLSASCGKMFKKSIVSSFHCRRQRMKQGLLIMLEECGQNNTVYWSIILRKKTPCPATQWLYTLNWTPRQMSRPFTGSALVWGSPRMGVTPKRRIALDRLLSRQKSGVLCENPVGFWQASQARC